jgi:AAA domain
MHAGATAILACATARLALARP